MNNGSVKLTNLVKTYPGRPGHPAFTAVKGINLEIKDGEFMVLVGPSGCGKSTTLRMVAGLESVTGGEIEIGGVPVNHIEPKDRGIAMVFQNYALYPHMTVFDNMAFGLKLAGTAKAAIRETVLRTATTLGLDQLLDRKPQALSGGQRQRVALGRAIVRNPKVFLFDEPLSNLDAQMRVQMRAEISRLHARLKTTMIYVTHDQSEAMTMGSRICVMNHGVIMQVADPLTLYRRPANVFSAGFIGSPPMNLFHGRVERRTGGPYFVDGPLAIPLPSSMAGGPVDQKIILGIRPEHLSRAGDLPGVRLACAVEIAEPMGAESVIYLKMGERSIVARLFGEHLYQPGEALELCLAPDKIHLFDSETGNALT